MERLLTAVDATAEADAVRKLRRDAQAAAFSAETRRAVQVVTGVEGHGLKPWREVITPHKDVRDGNMRGAEFAADLYWVSKGEGSREYVEPVEFFRRTYLTDGLRELLAAAARRIGGDRNAPPVWNLQTNFGGGKTHSMLALYHLLSGTPLDAYPDEVRKVLGGVTLPNARRAVLVGNHFKAGAATRKPDGTEIRTLWGELAWQLGFSAGGEAEARRAYEIVRSADETRSNPADALGTLISAYAPCLILIDEWVAYARQLYGRDDLAGGTFDTQFTFAQTLTEVVKAVPGALLVVSIPASSAGPTSEEAERGATDIEVGGLNGAQALARLQQVIHRIADQWRPASSVESFAIVRQRLFEDPGADAQADIGAVARVFTDFYAKNRAEFPSGVAEPSYEERIKSAYPLHPELFDRLYRDWSTLDRFQRTRGVLRLMSAVIHELWERDDPAPLILPGGVPLDADDVLTEISQYLEDSFKPVIDADIDGASSTPAMIDASRPALGQRKVTRRLARAIFLGSAPTLKAAHRGIERQHIWLGIATPGDTIGNFANALSLLSDQATYLYSEGARYWYSTAASVQKMAREHADRLKDRPEETWAEILRRLAPERSTRGMFTQVQIGPERSDDIPDEAAVRLVIVHPQFRHTRGDFASPAGHFASMAAAGARDRAPAEQEHARVPRRRRQAVRGARRRGTAVPGLDGARRDRGADQGTRAAAAAGGAGPQAARRGQDDRGPADLGDLPLAARPRADDEQPAADRRAEGGHEQGPPRRTGIRAAEERRHAAGGAGPAEHPAQPRPAPVLGLVLRAHRGRQAVGVLLPVPLPAPARRAVGAGERHPGRLQPGDLGPGRLRRRVRVRRALRAVHRAADPQ